jgi:hypothetical protein
LAEARTGDERVVEGHQHEAPLVDGVYAIRFLARNKWKTRGRCQQNEI